jgi:hypothetical protein
MNTTPTPAVASSCASDAAGECIWLGRGFVHQADRIRLIVAAILVVLSVACSSSESMPPRPTARERFEWESDPRVQRAISDAARQTGTDQAAVRVVSVEPQDWPNASLGCPKPGIMYAQVITPGLLIVLEAGGRRLEYHTDAGQRIEQC